MSQQRFSDRMKILALLRKRERGKTICPSEILPEEMKTNQERMEKVRNAARDLASQGQIEITQSGRVVDPFNFRGPIRLRLNQESSMAKKKKPGLYANIHKAQERAKHGGRPVRKKGARGAPTESAFKKSAKTAKKKTTKKAAKKSKAKTTRKKASRKKKS